MGVDVQVFYNLLLSLRNSKFRQEFRHSYVRFFSMTTFINYDYFWEFYKISQKIVIKLKVPTPGIEPGSCGWEPQMLAPTPRRIRKLWCLLAIWIQNSCIELTHQRTAKDKIFLSIIVLIIIFVSLKWKQTLTSVMTSSRVPIIIIFWLFFNFRSDNTHSSGGGFPELL